MGFLRKVGRKIKKGVKKLFSSKLGRIVGMVGLYFAMGAIAKGLTGTFGQAATTTAEAAATTTAEAAATTTAEAAATTGAEALTAAASNTEAAANAINTIENAANSGELVNASTSITDVVTNTNNNLFAEGDLFQATRQQSLVPTEGVSFSKAVTDPAALTQQGYADTFGQTLRKGLDSTGQFIKDIPTKLAEAPGKAYEYVTGPDFMPDVVKGAATSYVTSAIVGEPEQPFYSRGVQQVGAMEAPQSAYVAEVQRQMPQMQGMDFNQLNQSLFYGTLSPQWLMSQAQYG
jgi:hypothetical protein